MKASSYSKYTVLSILLMSASFVVAAVLPSKRKASQKFIGGHLEYSSNLTGIMMLTCLPQGIDCDPSIDLTDTSGFLQFTSLHFDTSGGGYDGHTTD